MTKPLQLTVYPKLERPKRGEDIMAFRSQFIDEMLIIRAKRFTDADLAAEYHAADVHFQRSIWQEMARGEDWPDAEWERIAHPVNALYRFATLPHYDEQEATA